MLVLARQRDQSILIGDDIDITVVDIRGDKVRLGINAPRNVSVHRKEVYEAIKRENAAAAQVQVGDLAGVPKEKPVPMKIVDQKPIRIAVLASGGGTTLQNLIDCIRDGTLAAEIAVVVASKPTSAAITPAEAVGIKTVIVNRTETPDLDSFSSQVFAA